MPSDDQLGPGNTSITIVLPTDLKGWLRRRAAESEMTMSKFALACIANQRARESVKREEA